MTRYQNPRNVPDEHMRLVGIIASNWQCLDAVLQDAVVGIMGIKDGDLPCLLVVHSTFELRMNLLQAYSRPAKKDHEDVWKEFDNILKEVRVANEMRNTYVHALWGDDQTPPTRFTIQVRNGKIINEEVPVSEAELERAAATIWGAADRLRSFCREYGMLPRA